MTFPKPSKFVSGFVNWLFVSFNIVSLHHKVAISMMLNPTFNGVAIQCHQLEAPELDLFYETDNLPSVLQQRCESTHQVLCGEFSALSELRQGHLRAVEAFTALLLNYRSNWVSGKSWRSSLMELSTLSGISVRYLWDTLSDLMV